METPIDKDKEYHRQYSKEYYEKRKEEIRELRKEKYRKNPPAIKEVTRSRRRLKVPREIVIRPDISFEITLNE